MELNEEDLKIVKSVMEQEIAYYIDEEFRYVSYPGVRPYMYAVSQYGNIVSIPSKRIMSSFDNNGYRRVSLRSEENGIDIKVRVHRLVAWEFCEGYDPENNVDVVNHKDSNRENNYAINLEWCTTSYNNKHAANTDHSYNSQRKFGKEKAHEICKLFVEGYTPRDVFTIITGYNSTCDDESTYVTIKNIYRRKTYNNVTKHYNWEIKSFDLKQRKLNDDQVNQICKWFSEGYNPKEVYTLLTGNKNTNQDKSTHVIILDIFKRKSYKHISDNYDW